jgi:hypothetical protein
MNSRVTAKRINDKERLIRRANSINAFLRFLGWGVTFVGLVLFWQFVMVFFGWDKSPESLLKTIKALADIFALPLQGVLKKLPFFGTTVESLYLLALGSYLLIYVLISQLAKLFVRVPGST